LKYKNTINDTKPSTENNTSSLSSTGNFQPLTAFKTSFENYDFNPNSRYNLASQWLKDDNTGSRFTENMITDEDEVGDIRIAPVSHRR